MFSGILGLSLLEEVMLSLSDELLPFVEEALSLVEEFVFDDDEF